MAQENWGPAVVKHWKHIEYYPAVNTHSLPLDIEHNPVQAVTGWYRSYHPFLYEDSILDYILKLIMFQLYVPIALNQIKLS